MEQNLRILLVDDNDDNRLIIKAFLRPYKWQIVEAVNGQEAVSLFQEQQFDLVFMDMQMPVMDGYTATREIRKFEKENGMESTPVVALTAYALKEEIEKSMAAGCHDHVTKPVAKNDLLRIVEAYTDEILVSADDELKDLIPDYLKRRGQELNEMKLALEKQDFELLSSLGHKLKGSAGSYGFAGLSKIGKTIEEKSKLKDTIGLGNALLQYGTYLSKVKVKFE